MKITDVMKLLQQLLDKHGDVDTCFDCPHCQRTTEVGLVVAGPVIAKLKQ